jgi:hypothetical protein
VATVIVGAEPATSYAWQADLVAIVEACSPYNRVPMDARWGLASVRRRAAILSLGFGGARRLDMRRWRRLLSSDSHAARDVVRALYVAVLEREPDPKGQATHAARLAGGLPIELIIADLARARDVEGRSTSSANGAVVVIDSQEAARLRDEIQAQRRTILALTRRLAALEDRLIDAGSMAAPDTLDR